MKKIEYYILLAFTGILIFSSCNKDNEDSELFELLTNHPWQSDSLLADGVEAGGHGELLHGFAGEALFKNDGTGYVGIYEGTWSLNTEEKLLTIYSDSLPAAATTGIRELTASSLKLLTFFPTKEDPSKLLKIRLTFVAAN